MSTIDSQSATRGFSYTPTPYLYQCRGSLEQDPPWERGELSDSTDVTLPAAAAVLSYGCGVLEGLTVRRTSDGALLGFRVLDHAARFARSAERLLMLPFPEDRFVDAVARVVDANVKHIPPAGDGAFYLRPLQYADEAMLGFQPPRRFRVTLYGCPVGSYFADRPLRLKVLSISRAAPGGTGGAKAIGNYAGGILHKQRANAAGFDDVIFVDGPARMRVQEASGANFFCLLRNGTLVTPALDDTVLPGITRASVIDLANTLGVRTVERAIAIDEVLADAREVLCCGTAWGVRSVGTLEANGSLFTFPRRDFADEIQHKLATIRDGSAPDTFGWTKRLDA